MLTHFITNELRRLAAKGIEFLFPLPFLTYYSPGHEKYVAPEARNRRHLKKKGLINLYLGTPI